jgi:hypothetical protein
MWRGSAASLTWFFQALLAGSFLLSALELTCPPVENWLALMQRVKTALRETKETERQTFMWS